MNDVGYTATYLKQLTGGICTIYCGSKTNSRSGIVAVFLLLASLIILFGQLRDGLNMPDNDDKPYHIGIVVMGVSSRFQISQHPNFCKVIPFLAYIPKIPGGIGIGGMHTFRIGRHWMQGWFFRNCCSPTK